MSRMTRVYVAAPFELRNAAEAAAAFLEGKGHEVTSTWHRKVDDETSETAYQDLNQVISADSVLLINPPEFAKAGTGGRHFECGYATAIGMHVAILGVRSNLFHHLKNVRILNKLEDF